MDRRLARGFERRVAFTLIELVMVLVIMALLSSLAVLSLGGFVSRYQMSQATESIERFDARARRDASRFRQPIEATIEKTRQRLVIKSAQMHYELPGSVKIQQVRVGRSVTVGSEIEIRFDREGVSPTYAVQLKRGKQSRWLVILGGSGQVVPLATEGEVNAILSL